MLPFVDDAKTFVEAKGLIDDVGWPNRLGTMLEVPAAALQAGSFLAAGGSSFLVGLNDLSALTLGRERVSTEEKHHPAIWRLIEGVHQQVGGRCTWGVGGGLSVSLAQQALEAGADLVTVHHDDLPDLTGIARD